MPVCEACRSQVSAVTREFEDSLCDLCLEIQRYDRLPRVVTGVLIAPVFEQHQDRRGES